MARKNGAQVSKLDLSFLIRCIFPLFRKAIDKGYMSLEISGAENLLENTPVIFVANHSGWVAIDGFLIPYALHELAGAKSIPYVVIHDLLYYCPGIGPLLKKVGAIPASWVRNIEMLPKEITRIGIFPEGEAGNCKPLWQAYKMRKWKRGFVKLAILKKAKVIPIAVHGLEECVPSVATVSFFKPLLGAVLPLPLLPVPLPCRCKITFCKPIDLSHYAKNVLDKPEVLDRIACDIQNVLQKVIDQESDRYFLGRLSGYFNKAK